MYTFYETFYLNGATVYTKLCLQVGWDACITVLICRLSTDDTFHYIAKSPSNYENKLGNSEFQSESKD